MRLHRRRPESPEHDAPVRLVALTSTIDQRRHTITDTDFADGARDGRFRAVCGHLVAPASLAEPDGPSCPRCADPLARPAWSRAVP